MTNATTSRLAIALHALAAQSWNKGPHESDTDFSAALIEAGEALESIGQNIHDDFDAAAMPVDADRMACAAALEIPHDVYTHWRGSPIEESRLLASSIAGAAMLLKTNQPAADAMAGILRHAANLDREAIRYMADARDANEQRHRATQSNNEYREQRDAANARVAELERELAEQREVAESLGARVLEANGRLQAVEPALASLLRELGGLTLSMLPKGAYGGALADAYCEARKATESGK